MVQFRGPLVNYEVPNFVVSNWDIWYLEQNTFMHLFTSLWVAQKFDTLPKGVCHNREECREDFKI